MDQYRHRLLAEIGSIPQLVNVIREFRRDPSHVVGFEILFGWGRGLRYGQKRFIAVDQRGVLRGMYVPLLRGFLLDFGAPLTLRFWVRMLLDWGSWALVEASRI